MINKNYFKDIFDITGYVREPVDEVCKRIKCSDSNKIILCGGRGSGKTNVLYHMETQGVGTYQQSIYIRFDTITAFYHTSDYQKLLIHYYELLISNHLLLYIKKYYSFTYQKYFLEFEPLINQSLDVMHHYINMSGFEEITLSHYLSTGEISKKLLEIAKKELCVESFTLMIDRFDWLHSEDHLQQSILRNYFDIFDKVIITCDDETITKENVSERWYSLVSVDYNKDCDVVTEILRRKIAQYNSETILDYHVLFNLNPEFVQILIDKTDGNISMMIGVIMEIRNIQNWEKEHFSFERAFNEALNSTIEHHQEVKKMSYHKPTLYL